MKIVIMGTFPGINDYVKANRSGWQAGNAMKTRDQKRIIACLPRRKLTAPIYIKYRFYCPNRRRDKDNISGYFHKIFQDALVEARLIKNDGWDAVSGFDDEFYIDRNTPRIEVCIYGPQFHG